MRGLAQESGSYVVGLHDMAQAARYADQLVIMQEGRIVAVGAPQEVLTAELVIHVYKLSVEIHPDPVTGTPVRVPPELGSFPQGRRFCA